MPAKRADDAAVADDEQRRPGVAAREIDERVVHTTDNRMHGLEAVGNAHGIEVPGPLRIDVVARQTFPRPDVGLDQARVEQRCRCAECGADELGGSGRALQRARDDRINRIEALGGEQCLSVSTLGERDVGASLPATGNVPLRLTVSEHEHAGDRR